jgi:hypothetical protein
MRALMGGVGTLLDAGVGEGVGGVGMVAMVSLLKSGHDLP